MDEPVGLVSFDPDPANPGWLTYVVGLPTRFNSAVIGDTIARLEDDGSVRVRVALKERHLNMKNVVHGGALLGFADVALFAAVKLGLGLDPSRSVTIDLQCQFLAGGLPSDTLDAVVEVLRETGRMAFLRGLMVQGDHRIAAFSATIRK